MLYAVTLTYIRPAAEIDAHLGTHRDWLMQHIASGHILVAGPLEPRVGGLVLLRCGSRAELDHVLALDSFHIHGLVEREVLAFEPALRAAAFPADWAPGSEAA
ncbi:YCII-related protein [Paracidovorax avenae ATCC 19860]|uniref:YCII-related protein n=1 Tax=Paracidovorax avenae (strain ATCC 19860 / DSM 7227 / CCUG 15838 / JCM 20985 / LMG 2117 / NCPPB 1011) TaxID=643561 RepID=F0Q5W9_PARA1|nr:YciI family protein [Paracidovorax avenae]ADX48050.1 YCII-related protein [Paracidovorax avenae ATCC 19860]